jgi:chemotaxis protein histidine kinase CheA
MMTMLRDIGQSNLTVEYLRGLALDSPERQQLSEQLKAWQATQVQLAEDRKRKRREEEEQRLLREEEERARIRAEEALLIQARQEQQKADEASVRAKAEELRRKQEEERCQREEDAQRAEQARLVEQQRIVREAEEAERKKREEAQAAALLAAAAQDAAAQRQLAALRAQQEADRLAEAQRKEAERQELARLAAEQAERDRQQAAERAAQAALQAKVAAAVAKHVCTLKETGEKFVAQQWYHCLTCAPASGAASSAPRSPASAAAVHGCCAVCRDICHAGHKLQDMGVTPFYCDCGKAGCEAATGIKPGQAGKPTLASIEAEFTRTGQKWVDPDFSPVPSSLMRDPATSKKSDWKELQWKRPEEFRAMKNPTVFADGADPLDINQGSIGDCWLLSAMSVMTQRQQDLLNIFVTRDHSAAGVYSVNFYKNGERINLLIDSNFPATKSGQVAFARSANANELWVMILEKGQCDDGQQRCPATHFIADMRFRVAFLLLLSSLCQAASFV